MLGFYLYFVLLLPQNANHSWVYRGGIILLDDKDKYEDLIRLVYDGRNRSDTPYNKQKCGMGYHYYMTPETADLGIEKLPQAIKSPPRQWVIEDWPDLRDMEIFG